MSLVLPAVCKSLQMITFIDSWLLREHCLRKRENITAEGQLLTERHYNKGGSAKVIRKCSWTLTSSAENTDRN